MSTMKAVVFNRKNKSKPFIVEQREKPVPKANEVLLKIKAVSLNAADYRSVQMHIVPKMGVLGADVAGIVQAVGEAVHQFEPGDEVIGDLSGCGFGGLAEYAVVPENFLIIKPAKLSFEEAAALPMAAVTALQALRNKGNIQANKKVLIAGSGGGVGTMAVQLAKHFGADVHAVSGPNNVEQSKELGATRVFDYTNEDFTKSGQVYDIIVAANGNRSLSAYKKMLRPNGIYVMVGGTLSQIFRSLLLGRFHSFGSRKMLSLAAKSNVEDLAFVANLAANENLKPVIDRQFKLEETDTAMKYIGAGHARGKVVIQMD